jgi:hypothetical protein
MDELRIVLQPGTPAIHRRFQHGLAERHVAARQSRDGVGWQQSPGAGLLHGGGEGAEPRIAHGLPMRRAFVRRPHAVAEHQRIVARRGGERRPSLPAAGERLAVGDDVVDVKRRARERLHPVRMPRFGLRSHIAEKIIVRLSWSRTLFGASLPCSWSNGSAWLSIQPFCRPRRHPPQARPWFRSCEVHLNRLKAISDLRLRIDFMVEIRTSLSDQHAPDPICEGSDWHNGHCISVLSAP